MRKLDIQITKAAITGFSIDFGQDQDKLSVNATISLISEYGKHITSYSIRSDAWNDEDKFDIPPSMVEAIKSIALDLEKIVAKHCQEGQLILDSGDE